jgi:hypothetical protein
MRIYAQPGFRFISASNTGELGLLPEFIRSRMRPVIKVGYPPRQEIDEIIQLPVLDDSGSFGTPWIWPPCESLIYGLGFKALEISNSNQSRFMNSELFDGSLQGGIDIRATSRSIIRGEQKLYVKKLASNQENSMADGLNPDPFIYIFPEPQNRRDCSWRFLQAGSNLSGFVKDIDLFNRICNGDARIFVSSVSLEEYVVAPAHYKALNPSISKIHGTVMFGNPCINAHQSAIWLESANYKCCPILSEYGISGLLDYYSSNFNLKIDLSNWQESLIRMAIPFTKKSLTIIAPDSFQIPKQALIEAHRKRVSVNVVGFSNFAESLLEEARHLISVTTLDSFGLNFPPEAEIILGQPKETHFELLPPAMRKQVGYHENQ